MEQSMVQSSFRRILIRTPNWLGDLMMSTAFLQFVLDYYPEATVDLIVKKGFEQIPLPHRGDVFPFDKKKDSPWRFGTQFRRRGYDAFYVLPPSFSSALMARATAIPQCIGYRGGGRSLLLNRAQRYVKPHRTQHLIHEYAQLILKDTPLPAMHPALAVTKEWSLECLAKIQNRLPSSYVLLAPGALYGPAKQWPVSYYRELAQLLGDFGLESLVIGTKDDAALGKEICKNNSKSQNFCGLTSLNELIALMHMGTLLVSNDSGTMHIMAALQKPQIAIFGSTSMTWTSPMNEQAKMLSLSLDCSPCYKRTCPFGHYHCLKQISPQQVFQEVVQISNGILI